MKAIRTLICLYAALAASQPVAAAPLTLAFEAEIDDVFRSTSTTIDLEIGPGDKVTGKFTFEPFFLPPLQNPLERQDVEVFQQYRASVQLGEKSLQTPSAPASLTLTAVNNAFVLDDQDVLQDSVQFGGELIQTDTYTWPSLGSAELQMELWGHSALLRSAGIPGDVAVLNQFEFLRSLRVTLVDASGELLVVRATIGGFTAVPEPLTGGTALLMVACGVCLATRLRGQVQRLAGELRDKSRLQ